jgi:alkylhydroperoxidase family enzyme
MARIPDVRREDLAPEDQPLMARDIALYRTLANSPKALRAFSGLGQFIRHTSRLDPRLRELAILQVGYVARAPYEWSHHIRIGMDFGVTEADIHALIADTEGRDNTLEPLARLVLLAAREAAAGPGVSAETFAALSTHLDAERLTDLVVTIGFYCAVVRVLASLDIQVEPEYRHWLERFPLPAG